jgi:hypothetical protein
VRNNDTEKTKQDSAQKTRQTESGDNFPRKLMSALILLVLGIVVAVLWGVAINYYTNRDPASLRLSFWWLIPALLVTCAITLIAYWNYVVEPAQSSTENSLKTEPRRPTFREKVDKVMFRLGNNYATFDYKELQSQSVNLMHLGGGHFLTARILDNKPLIDVDVYAGDGKDSITVRDNEFTKPPNWDSNSNDAALEIINENQEPVLQIVYESPMQIAINGMFRTAQGKLITVTKEGGATKENPNHKQYLKRLFKYPSWRYPGEFADIETSLDGNRPELSVDRTHINLGPNMPIWIEVQLTNRGDATARNLKTDGYYVARPADIKGPIQRVEGGRYDWPDEIIRKASMTQRIDLGPGILHPAAFAALHRKSSILFIFLDTTYADDRGILYSLTKCYQYDPELRRLIIAPREYWPGTTEKEEEAN